MSCRTQQEIAEAVQLPERTVYAKIADFCKNGSSADSTLFRNPTPELYSL